MNDDPTQVNVVYAKVHDMSDNQCLQSIADYLYSRFEESQLLCRSHDFNKVNPDCKVKLHVTLMNTSFRQRDDKQDWRRDRGRTPTDNYFDASGILNKFKDYYFGEIIVETIEISIRSSSLGRNGYYSHTSRIEL